MSDAAPDVWSELRAATPARIGLGRRGAALPVAEVLALRTAHAHARDAVWHEPAWSEITAELDARGVSWVSVHSAVPDRATYLLRPDLGRRLRGSDVLRLRDLRPPQGAFDAVVCLADGLSGEALTRHGATVVTDTVEQLTGLGWRLAPVVLVHGGRVAIGDEIGEALGADLAIVGIGERPGLSAADSLGIYLTHHPRPGLTDAQRICISNVRSAGLPPPQAARQAVSRATAARQLGYTGTGPSTDPWSLPDSDRNE